jgi:2-desacetyl-2-hydroxyethyl bacteriochlorophyllide A dehydrogenase
MRCAVFYGRHDLRIEERPVPEIEPLDVLLQVKACGVCGTDVHIYEGDKGAADCPSGTIIGHEFSGIIVRVGQAVRDFVPGDRVCVDPNKLCGSCCYCKAGIGHFCESMIGIGTTVDGGFAEYCRVPASQLTKIADGTSFLQAAMTEPVACCLHGIDLCNIKPGSNVLVIGGGMIGLIMLQLTKLSGAANVILLEPITGKREMAQTLGADLAIDPLTEDVKAVLHSHGLKQIDTVIECVGKITTIEQAIDLAGKYATVMMFGLTKPDDKLSILPFTIFQKEITLRSSFINPYTQARAAALIDSGKLDVSSMVCPPASLADLTDILSNPQKRAAGKYIICPEQ